MIRPRREEAQASSSKARPFARVLPLVIGYYGLMAWAVRAGLLPGWVLPASLALNLLTFLAYAVDKSAAVRGRWRTKEDTLHALSLAGGWAGAGLAQQLLRHKSSKQSFRTAYWLTLAAHCAVLGALLWVRRG
ncbi:DUF1294 domain-containing protein [Ramlibacter sp.]|uniref:DUF1294 domain-containing protein n=1 Tax=Ramlibacter sp. TaxID=1917967 RepID=UPI0025D4EA53|nr:DUF1294 domain-containing protein [Ramlibacter sp.]